MGISLEKLEPGTRLLESYNPLMSLINYSIYIIGILFASFKYRQVLNFIFKDIFLCVLLTLSLLSTIWSEVPVSTFFHSISLLAITIFAVHLGTSYSLNEMLRLFRWSLAIIAILGLVFALFMPVNAFMIDLRTGLRFQGLLSHPTNCGRIMVLSIVLWLIHALHTKHYRVISWSIVAISTISLVITNTVSAYLSLLELLILLLLLRTFKTKNVVLISFVLFFITSIITILATNYETALDFFRRDTTGTGRTILWEIVWEKIMEHPVLGYGFNAFWTGLDGPCADIWQRMRWQAPHAHNGLLDVGLQLGFLGMSALLISLVRNIFIAIGELKQSSKLESILPITLITFIILSNLTDVGVLSARQSIIWFLYVYLSTYLSRCIIYKRKNYKKYQEAAEIHTQLNS
ncbi:O-antigen ligase family protein [Chroococcidiopsis sp. FACHB-1243]|uniref:O-antigen ligase family protein n=1 Tax=Chroococcidiopsis sp. [FACHB-1243] TaxID=2692781 RepID=UPI00177EA23C|nr:O-antigen ligase family protein [Chroococcidiopsis sp. [FACHB-1243]]MBD2305815.1 O-antigen ligase family protein [Chroococcidiopsis sp. [FACHB-1243]]